MNKAAILTQTAATGVNNNSGIVYITDVFSEYGNIQKYFKQNTIPKDQIVERVLTDTKILSVEIKVEATNDYKIPAVAINGLPVELEIVDQETRKFKGILNNINFEDETQIIVRASNGAVYIADIEYLDIKVHVTSIQILSFPKEQTTFKENDEIILFGVLNKPGYVAVDNYGALKATDFVKTNENNEFTINAKISNRNGNLNFKLITKSELGTIGEPYISNETIDVENINFDLSNYYISYPNGQLAIKADEAATLYIQTSNIFNEDDYLIEFISPNNSVMISNPKIFSNIKTIHSLINYNLESLNNIRLSITKKSNKYTKEFNYGVNIQCQEPNVNIFGPKIIDSGNNSVIHNFEIHSDCYLKSVSPMFSLENMNIEFIPITHEHAFDKIFKFGLKINSNSTRGKLTLTFEYVTASLQTYFLSYEVIVAGFNEVIASFDAWPNRMALFGRKIYDINNVKVINLSKGTEMHYKNNKADEENAFTIVDENGNISLSGGYIYNCDMLNAVSNTSGELKLSIQEIIIQE